MASYLLNTSFDDVVTEAFSYLQCLGPVNRTEDPNTGKVMLSSKVPISANLLAPKCTCSFEQAARGTLVTTSFRLPIYYKAGMSLLLLLFLLLSACIILFLKPLVTHLANEFVSNVFSLAAMASGITPKRPAPSQNTLIGLLALVDAVLLVAILFCGRKISLTLSQQESVFWKALKGCGTAELIAPSDYTAFLRGVPQFLIILFPLLFILFCWQISIWLILPGLLVVLLFTPSAVATLCFRNQLTTCWKPILLTFILKWIMVNIGVAIAFALILGANVGYFRNLAVVEDPSVKDQAKIRALPTLTEITQSLERTSKDRIAANRALLLAFGKQATETLIATHPGASEHAATIQEIFVKFATFNIGFAVVGGLAIMAFYWCQLVRVPREWRQLLASEQPIHVLIPSLAQLEQESPLILATCFSVYVAGLFINWVSAAIGIDALTFIFTSKTLIIPQTETLFAWIPAIFLFLSENLRLCSSSTSLALSRLVLLAFAIPVCFFCTSKLSYLIASVACKAAHAARSVHAKTTVPAGARQWIEEVCQEEKLPKPRLRIIPFQGIRVRLRVPLFVLRPAINISPAAIHELSTDELRAVLGHEIGHLRQDARKLSFMRVLSTIGLFPNSVLALLFNFARRELEADLFALYVTKKPRALINAITKTYASRISLGVSPRTKMWRRVVQVSRILYGPAVFFRFFFSPEILGYTHVHPVDRVKQIQSQLGG